MKSDCLPSSQRHLWMLWPITAKPRDKRTIFPSSLTAVRIRALAAPRKHKACLHQEPLAGGWHGMCLLALFLHVQIFFAASPALSKHCSPLLGLGEHFWVTAAGVIGGRRTPSHPARVCKFSGLPAALPAAAASWGRTGGTEQGPLLLGTAALGLSASPRNQAWQLFPRWRTGPWGYWPSVALLPQKSLKAVLCCRSALNCTKPHAPLCYP